MQVRSGYTATTISVDDGGRYFRDECCAMTRRKFRAVQIKIERDRRHRIVVRDRKFRGMMKKRVPIHGVDWGHPDGDRTGFVSVMFGDRYGGCALKRQHHAVTMFDIWKET